MRRFLLLLACLGIAGTAGASGISLNLPQNLRATDSPTFAGVTAKTYDKGAAVYNVVSYLADSTGTADSTTPIQNAINAAVAAGGGVVVFPAGNFKITSSLTVRNSGVTLKGIGGYANDNVGGTPVASRLFWAGTTGGWILDIAPVDSGSSASLKNVRVEDLMLDGNDTAGTGLSLQSTNHFLLKDLVVKECQNYGIRMKCVSSATLLDDKGVTNGTISDVLVRELASTSATGICLSLEGDSDNPGNTSNCVFSNVYLVHKNATALRMANCDNNRLDVRISRSSAADTSLNGGVGAYGVELVGSNVQDASNPGSSRDIARSNVFTYLSTGKGGLKSWGTGTYTYAAARNRCYFYSKDNGEPPATVDTGSDFVYQTDNGFEVSNLLAPGGTITGDYFPIVLRRVSGASTGRVGLGFSHGASGTPAIGGALVHVRLGTGDYGAMEIWTKPNGGALTNRWEWDENGHYFPIVNNTYDLGTASLAPRNLYVAQDITQRRAFQTKGTALVAGDWSASGWGASAVVTVTGNDCRGVVTVTTNAADTPSANPTLTLTFHDGTWTSAPFGNVNWESTSTGPIGQVSITTTATTGAIKYNATPTATSASTYKFCYRFSG